MESPLTDLDELVQRCRDDRTRSFFAEAVASYKGGAFRAAIVGTWIAVCFDVIEKLRELSIAGDAEAEVQVEELEKTRKAGDLGRALKFEKEILTLARDKFELISHLEHVDLERLQQDRNRCAHPSLLSDDQAYSPSAELARAHIHAAVTHLLQHPPTQGKHALERLVREIDSEYFPQDVKLAVKAFSSGPLKRPRESLVRNLALVLMKRILQEGVNGSGLFRTATALRAVRQMHPLPVGAVLSSKLPFFFRSLGDGDLEQAIVFLERVPDCWQHLPDDVSLRLQSFVQRLPVPHFYDLDFLLGFEPLRRAAETRVSYASAKDLRGLLFFTLPAKIGDRLISLLLEARTSAEADDIASALAMDAGDLSGDQVKRIILNAAKNARVINSPKFGHLVERIRERTTLPATELDVLFEENELGEYSCAKSSDDDDIPF